MCVCVCVCIYIYIYMYIYIYIILYIYICECVYTDKQTHIHTNIPNINNNTDTDKRKRMRKDMQTTRELRSEECHLCWGGRPFAHDDYATHDKRVAHTRQRERHTHTHSNDDSLSAAVLAPHPQACATSRRRVYSPCGSAWCWDAASPALVLVCVWLFEDFDWLID